MVSLTFTMYKHKFVFEVSNKPLFGVSFSYVRSYVIVGISCFHIVIASCLGGRPRSHIIGGWRCTHVTISMFFFQLFPAPGWNETF
jgi:hypothetical protein